MRTIVKGKNFEVPERDRRYAERKLRRLDRMLDDRSDAVVELSVEQHRSVEDSHIVDVTLVMNGRPIRGKAMASTHRAGIDEVLDKVERQAVDSREKPRSKRLEGRENASAAGPLRGETTDDTDEGGAEDGLDAGGDVESGIGSGSRTRVTKVKRFAIEPMFEEDAVARMDELGHAFFVFVNAETERIAILYRRQAGDFGLIEPMVGGGYTKGGPVGSSPRRGAGSARR